MAADEKKQKNFREFWNLLAERSTSQLITEAEAKRIVRVLRGDNDGVRHVSASL